MMAARPVKKASRLRQVPPREYELAARLLVQVVASDPGDRSRAVLGETARRLGAELGRGFRASATDEDAADRDEAGRHAADQDVEGALMQQGYEPSRDDGVIRLRNCPFHQLAVRHRDVVCNMNLALILGVVAGLGADSWRPALDPRPGYCCVAIGGDQP